MWRLGVLRASTGYSPALDRVFDQALDALRAAGAEVVELPDVKPAPDLGKDETVILAVELKAGLADYLSHAAPAVTARSLADLIAFNRAHADVEMAYFGQDGFERAQAAGGLDDSAYLKARNEARRLAGAEGIDRLLADNRLDALIAPTTSPAWTTDLVNGDHYTGGAGSMAAIAGDPHLTVPMGQVHGLPVGLSLMGAAWSEASLLAMGYAFEQAAHARRPPAYRPSLP